MAKYSCGPKERILKMQSSLVNKKEACINSTRGLHLVKLCHSTFIRGIWNNTPIFKKYWKIPPKIVFFNPLPICLADFKKPLFSLYIACIHFFIYIFYTPLYFYLREKKTKHKKGRHLIGAPRQITLLWNKIYHMMSKQI